ncbi:uncharacterized protein [Typha angustifolia]|uniref:uncharacterized protein n=1 Tax=Typha angustifolia TaxID=59011 RepID=UPI003C2CF59A
MLSIENPPDPSCSSKLSSLRTNERASEKLAFQEADPVGLGDTPTPNFSIRNYVSSSRSKGIETSWPFHPQVLQLCLKHGVKDILPPFEPPDLVRAHSHNKRVVIEQPTTRSEADQTSAHAEFLQARDADSSDRERSGFRCQSCSPLAELVPGCSDQALHPSPEARKSVVDQEGNCVDLKDSAEIDLAATSDDKTGGVPCQISQVPCSIPVNSCITEEPSELVVSEPAPLPQKLPISRESLGKKCRLVVKLSSAPETSRAEDLVSNCSTVTDPMASKICPVCKIFASTSNTTLNAHIDQCLSMESSTKQDETSFLKLKVKPRKKKLMADIYTTAPRCTLEDLDRRNGTNWASELALAAAITEVRSDNENQKLVPLDSRGGTCEGAVYVDSNGVKLRILSKFDDTPPVVSRETFRLQKVTKDKESENILVSKKEHLGPKYSMNKKSKLQRKKLGPFKLLNAPIHLKDNQIEAQPEDVHKDAHQEDSLLDLSKDQDHSMISRPATLRQWVCSKRSDLPKKLNNKDACKTSENLIPVPRKLAGKSQPDVGDSSAVVGQILKSSKSSEGIPISPKTRSVDFLSNMVHKIDDERKEPPKPPVSDSQWSSRTTNGLRLRLSRSLGASVSFPSSKREEIGSGKIHKPNSSFNMTVIPADCSHPSAKCQTTSVEKKVDSSDKPATIKRCRKHRTILRTRKRRGEISTAVPGETHGSIKDWDGDIEHANKKLRTRQSKIIEDVMKSVTGNIADQVSPCQSIIPECRNAVDQGKAGNQEDNKTCLTSEAECCDPESQMQVGFLVSEGHVISSTQNVIDNPVSTKSLDLENHKLGVDSVLNPYRLAQLRLPSPSMSEAHAEALVQGSSDKHVRHRVHAPSDKVVNEHIQFSGDFEVTEENNSSALLSKECLADPSSLVQESGACLNSHGDLSIETPQESSSITSNREGSNGDHSLDTERETPESPVSTTSTMSLLFPKDIGLKESDLDLLARASAAQDQLVLPVPSTKSVTRSQGIIESMNQEAKAILPAKEHEQVSSDKPYCCSCRESLSRESQFLRQSAISGTLLASKGKQVSRLSISSRTSSSSFTSYQNPRKKLIANCSLELPIQSISSKASSESAINFPACINAGSSSPSSHTQIPSPSNPVLRLMGKNLLVVNKDDIVPPQTPNSEYSNNGNYVSPLGVVHSTSVLRQDNFQYHHLSGSAVISPYPSMGNHHIPLPRAPFQNALMLQADQHYLQKSYKEPIPPSRVPYMMKEVIVIDDSPENVTEPKVSLVIPTGASHATTSVSNPMPPRSFSCFPSQGHFFPRDLSEGSRPVLPMLYPRVSSSLMKRESTSECPGPFVPSPFMFQSPTGRMSPSMYYSQTLR